MASIHFICPVCRQSLKVAASLAGRKGRCPFCSAKVRIPVADHGTAEVLDASGGGKQDGSAVAASAPAAATGNAGIQDARGLKGAGDVLPSLATGQDIRPDDGIPSMGPRGAAAGAMPDDGNLQSQLDRQLGDAAPEHRHQADAATIKYDQDAPPPVIEPEDGAKTKLPGEDGTPPAPPLVVTSDTPPSAAEVAGEDPNADLPETAKGATLKYDPEHNPVRTSAELRNLTTREFGGAPLHPPGGNARTPPVSLAIPPPGHAAVAAATPTITPADLPAAAASGAAAVAKTIRTPSAGLETPAGMAAALPEAAARTAAIDDLLAANSENQVGDVLAGLPRERAEPTAAVANLGSPRGVLAQSPVTAVQGATVQSPTVVAGGAAIAQAGGSLIGDKVDPSRAGVSAGPLIAAVAAVILIIGGLTAWLVVAGLNRRSATIQSSQAFLRVSDLAVAEREYFSQAQPAATDDPAPAAGGEYAVSISRLEERGLVNPALWSPADIQRIAAAIRPGEPVELAQGNGYRYLVWAQKQVAAGQAETQSYIDEESKLSRGFAVAAIPTDAPNWAYAIDDRSRMIQWWYDPGAIPQDSGAPPSVAQRANWPVWTGAYPADDDFDKLPIR